MTGYKMEDRPSFPAGSSSFDIRHQDQTGIRISHSVRRIEYFLEHKMLKIYSRLPIYENEWRLTCILSSKYAQPVTFLTLLWKYLVQILARAPIQDSICNDPIIRRYINKGKAVPVLK
jgi:hypothetical protein